MTKKVVIFIFVLFVIVAIVMIVRNAMNKPKAPTASTTEVSDPPVTPGCASVRLAKPPDGKRYICKDDSWQLVNI